MSWKSFEHSQYKFKPEMVREVQWLSSWKMDMVTQVQNLDEPVWISYWADNNGKCMNPTILPPAIGVLKSILGSLMILWKPVIEKVSSDFKLVKLRLETDLVWHINLKKTWEILWDKKNDLRLLKKHDKKWLIHTHTLVHTYTHKYIYKYCPA